MKYLIVFQFSEEDTGCVDSILNELKCIDSEAIYVNEWAAIVSTELSVAETAKRINRHLDGKDSLIVTTLTAESHIKFDLGERPFEIPKVEQLEVSELSERQLEVFRLIGEGRSTSEIARMLFLSVHTIESHRGNIKRKLGLTNANQLVISAAYFVSRW